jgi:hypothetical protein
LFDLVTDDNVNRVSLEMWQQADELLTTAANFSSLRSADARRSETVSSDLKQTVSTLTGFPAGGCACRMQTGR